MKRVIIVHCWGGNPEYCWYPQTKKELETLGFEVRVPEMPDTEHPKESAWVPKLAEVVGEPNEDLYLVGHSIGCATIMRYLESLQEGRHVGGVVFVAGFTDNLGIEEISNFFERPINLENIKKKAKHFAAIHSSNDPFVPLKHGNVFEEQLGADLVVKEKQGHFSGTDDQEGETCTSLPEVARFIQEMSERYST